VVKEKNRTIIDKIWELFASVKFAVIIFAIISLTSIVGTLLEQQAEPEKNMKVLERLFGESMAPNFASSLIICSIERLPRILKMVKEPIRPLPVEHLEKMSIKKALNLKGRGSAIKDQALYTLKKLGFKPSEFTGEKGIQLYAEKGNFTRLGVYLTHLSILIILGGAIIGSFWGFNAFLPLQEGETSSVAYIDRKPVQLGFEIRCDNFEIDFYDNRDTPKDYKSWLTVIKNGKEVMKKTIEVNDPLKYGGITFYQSSYGTVPEGIDNGIFVLRLFSSDGKTDEVNPKIGDRFTIPGTDVEGHIKDFSPAFSIDSSGKAVTFSEKMINPAVYIEFSESGEKKYSGWILKRYPQTWGLPDGNRVEFLGYWGVEYTGMQVRKDPGVFIVYLGCLIMSIGLYITFFMSHKRIWINIADDKNKLKILIGASANKNRAAFERKIEKLVSILTARQRGGD
jgi:cytochrome c biogenesis protein